MGVLAPGSEHARHSAQPPIDTSANVLPNLVWIVFDTGYLVVSVCVCVWGEGGAAPFSLWYYYYCVLCIITQIP